jgi:hypothetical protein
VKRSKDPKGVRLGPVNDETEIVALAVALAPAYVAARWRWSVPFQRAHMRGHFPTADEIADHIRGTKPILAELDSPWCSSGGIWLFKEDGGTGLGVDPRLRAHLDRPEEIASQTPGVVAKP